MNTILSTYSASISELKRNPSRLLDEAGGEAIAILNHNKPTAYLLPAELYELLHEMMADQELAAIVAARKSERSKAVELSLDEL